jgi:hypothetical protein
MAGERTFVVKFISDTGNAIKGVKRIGDELGGLGKKLGLSVPSFKQVAIASAAATGAIAAGLFKAAQAAAEDQKSQALLADQLVKTTGATTAQIRQVEDYIDVTQRATGIADDQLRPAIATLTRATGDSTKAQELLGLALDISAGSGKELETVTLALAKGVNGNVGAFTKLGIPLDANIVKTKDFAAAQAVLTKQFGGASAVAAGTFEGQMKRLNIIIGEAVESIGYAILNSDRFKDVMQNLPNAVQAAIDAFGTGGLSGALGAFADNMGYTGAQVKLRLLEMKTEFFSFVDGVTRALQLLSLPLNLIFGTINTITGSELRISTPADTKKQLDDANAALAEQKKVVEELGIIYNENNRKTKAAGAESARWTDIARSLGATLDVTASSSEKFGGGVKKTADSIKKATDKLKEYGDALKTVTSNEKSLSDAQKSANRARKSQAEADLDVAQAVARLNQISRGFGADSPEAKAAQVELARAQRAQERATMAVEEAIYSVADAEKNLAEVRRDPESSPMDIRRAELNLADAKLSVADATDSQVGSTKDLNDQQTILNETIFGATIGSMVYDEALKDVTEAKERQMAAAEALADAIDREREAQDRLNQSLQATADLIAKYPKVLGGMPNPMAGVSSQVPVTAGGGFALRPNDTYQININAAIAEQGLPQKVVEALQQYNRSIGKIPVTTK